MPRFCFTGNPFVDAGVAGMCAAADIASIQDLDADAVDTAVKYLLRVLAGDSAFEPRQIPGKKNPTTFASSEMSAIFPNSPLCNPSYVRKAKKREEYTKRIQRKYEAFKGLAEAQERSGNEVCFVDGSPAVFRVGNDEFPMVDSRGKRNFHPGLQDGHSIGALTALALEFFPLSVLRTGINTGIFWFVHTADDWIAIECARLTVGNMNQCAARREGLGFYGDWGISSREAPAALVALIRHLATGSGDVSLGTAAFSESDYPVMAYIFSNDNRTPHVRFEDLPHALFRFFSRLHSQQIAFARFRREVLDADWIGVRAARRMLETEPLAALCTRHRTPERTERLLGGWRAHCYYAREAGIMSSSFIKSIEEIALRITDSDKAGDFVLALRQRGSARGALLRICRAGLMTDEELFRLAPPDSSRAAQTAREYLLAAIYDAMWAAENGKEFERWGVDAPEPEGKHPLVALAERVGSSLVNEPDIGKRAATDLARAKRLTDLRVGMLRPVRRGILNWRDFVDLFPPEQVGISFLERDYLLAYLYTHLRDPELPDAAEPEGGEVETEILKY